MLRKLQAIPDWRKRAVIVLFSAASLLSLFLFQKTDYYGLFSNVVGFQYSSGSSFFIFSFNKTTRFLLNDFLTVLMIYGIFYQRKYVIIALLVQALGLVVLLPSYLTFKYFNPTYNGPLINFLHRLTLNPLLLLMLIPLFFYQQSTNRIA